MDKIIESTKGILADMQRHEQSIEDKGSPIAIKCALVLHTLMTTQRLMTELAKAESFAAKP